MKRLAIVAAVIAFLVLLTVGIIFWPAISFVHSMSTQMKIGQRYMDSLKESDIPIWMTRTKELLAKYDPKIGTYGLDGKAISTDLQQLKIIGIDVDSNTVSYVWLGGMDHTELVVQRKDDGSCEFIARYDNESSRVIWPKKYMLTNRFE